MASLIKGIYNFIKDNTPKPVKDFVAPVVKPVVDTIKPTINKIDEKIDQGVQTVKKSQVNQNPRPKPKTKSTGVNYKKGDYISEETKGKVNKIANEEIDAANELGEAFLKDPLGSVNKLVGDTKNLIVDHSHSAINSLQVGWNKMNTKIAQYNVQAQERKLKALEYSKENPNAFNMYDPYGSVNQGGQMYLQAQNSNIDDKIMDADVELTNLNHLFNINKAITIKSMQTRDEFLNDYTKNMTTIGKFGANAINGLYEQFGNPPEMIKNTGINLLSAYVGVQTGNPYVGKLLDIVLSAGDNALTTQDDMRMYQGREATKKELMISAGTGVAFSETLNFVGKGLKKGYAKIDPTMAKLNDIQPKQKIAEFWNKFPLIDSSSQFAFEGNIIKDMIYTESNLKTKLDGKLEQKRFFSKVKNDEISKVNYDVKKDPAFKLEYDHMKDDSFLNSMGSNKNINPKASVFSKVIQSVPDDLEVTNKIGTPYVGVNRIKQHLNQTRGADVKANMVKALQPTVEAIAKDRANANKNPVVNFIKKAVMGEEKADAHFFTSVNQNLTYEKIGNSIIGKYNGALNRIEADHINRMDSLFEGQIKDNRDLVRAYKHDKNLFTKVYLEAEYDNMADSKLYSLIDGIREDSQTLIKLDKAWNDSVDPIIIQKYPDLFTSEGVNEKEAFKIFLNNFEGIEKHELKQIKTVYDFRATDDKFKKLLERADTKLRGSKAPVLNTAELLDLVKKVREVRGTEIYYDTDTDSLITRKYTKAEKKLFGIGKETKTPNLFKISELVERYKNVPFEKYENNSFKYLTEDNFKMGRVESVFDKSKFFREFKRNVNTLGEFKNAEDFKTEIFPKILENFDVKEDLSISEAGEIYTMLHNTIRDTTQASHLKGASTELGEILPFFKSYDNMVKFFNDMDYFYNNEAFAENVINKTMKKQAQYMTLGKPANSFINDVNFNLTKDIELNNNVKLQGLYLESINGMKDKVNTAVQNRIIKNNVHVTENNTPRAITKGIVNWARDTYLLWSGTGENLTNRAYSNLRVKEYMSTVKGKRKTDVNTALALPVDFLRGVGTGIDALASGFSQLEITEDFARSFKKAAGEIMGEGKLLKMSDGDTSILYSVFDNEFNKVRHWDSLTEIHDNIKTVGLSFQNTSEMHRHVIGVFNTNKAIFDTLNLKYDEVSPSMGKLMLINGIGEAEFNDMKTILRRYKNDGKIIQPQQLLDLDIEGFKSAGNLVALYDNLFYELNVLNKARAYVKGDFAQTMQGAGAKIFRSTTQGMSTDTFNKMLYFETGEGVLKNRFLSSDGLMNTAKRAPAIIPAIVALGLTNNLGNLQKQMLTGRHDALQTLSVSLAEESVKLNEVINSENPQELIYNLAKYNAETILEVLQDNAGSFTNSNMLDLVYNQIGKNVYRVLTNKKEHDRGTAGVNTLKGVGRLLIASVFGDKSNNAVDRGKRAFEEHKFFKETGEHIPYDLTLIDRIKDPDLKSRAAAIYHSAKAKEQEFQGIEKVRGFFETFVITSEFLKPESQSIFKETFDNFFKDEKKVKEFISNAAENIDSEMKTGYEKALDSHYKYLLGKFMLGEISEEEFQKLYGETLKNSNIVSDANFSLMNKEYANLFNDIVDYRNMDEEQKQAFKEEFMNRINQVQGNSFKVDEDKFFKALDDFVPESEQENFFKYLEERPEKTKEEPKEVKKSTGKNEIVEVIGGAGGYTDVLYSDGSVFRRTGSRAARNNNPGNMDSAPWQKNFNSLGNDKTGEHTNNYNKDARNAVFATYEDGVRAYKHLVFERDLYKNKTISSVISTYAPPNENNTSKYIQEAMVGIPAEYRSVKMKDWPEQYREKLMKNMFRVEDSGGGFKEEKIGEIEK